MTLTEHRGRHGARLFTDLLQIFFHRTGPQAFYYRVGMDMFRRMHLDRVQIAKLCFLASGTASQ